MKQVWAEAHFQKNRPIRVIVTSKEKAYLVAGIGSLGRAASSNKYSQQMSANHTPNIELQQHH